MTGHYSPCYDKAMSGNLDYIATLSERIRGWARDAGFQQAGISGVDLQNDELALQRWLALGYHGTMDFMAKHGTRRSRPAELRPGTLSVISVRMDYFPPDAADAGTVLNQPERAYVSRYALGRDYHKVLRRRLQQLADRIQSETGSFGYRVFVDSGPVLEKPLARNAGVGWIGKHTNLINSRAGSWFFLGELLTDLPLAADEPATEHCGTCRACIDVCPTEAIVAPFQLDARRCVSYLTIELRGSIPESLRPGIGNRVFGCDDCQLVCPWNKFAQPTDETDFLPRHHLDDSGLVDLFAWTETEFLDRTAGSPIRRIGYECWLRNIAVALGNAPSSAGIIAALEARRHDRSCLVREHVAWALERCRSC
ncbi:MAG: tRNA epoxyqueuosine(34) reductase QueG [Gammaproteobacteria bacterium]|nr:tRNA epoxyqueuosine(34) reductase QueG [Gammaproteobacteria bacterium]